jgi:hypothetical protein
MKAYLIGISYMFRVYNHLYVSIILHFHVVQRYQIKKYHLGVFRETS